MKLNKRLGMLLLGIYLILYGVITLLKVTSSGVYTAMSLFVLVVGIVLLLFDQATT
jgi:uncharacterized membrane protein HdeD (DUF308 family)